jgi:hypothetical protein
LVFFTTLLLASTTRPTRPLDRGSEAVVLETYTVLNVDVLVSRRILRKETSSRTNARPKDLTPHTLCASHPPRVAAARLDVGPSVRAVVGIKIFTTIPPRSD